MCWYMQVNAQKLFGGKVTGTQASCRIAPFLFFLCTSPACTQCAALNDACLMAWDSSTDTAVVFHKLRD